MDILNEMAKNGGERSGSLSKNRSDFQLHYAMCLYFAEYLSNKKKDFQIILDYDDDISLVKDNQVSFYQVKTSSVEQVLTEKILSGTNSDYITNLYKHVHKLGLQGIRGLFLISNLKIHHAGSLLEELSLDNFSDTDKEKIISLIKNKYKIEKAQTGFLAITKIRHTELPVNNYVTYVKGKLIELLEQEDKSLSYDPVTIYTCIKSKFDKQNNFEKFDKISTKDHLINYKGIDSQFLRKLIECAISSTYNDCGKKYQDLLNSEKIAIQEYRNFMTGLTQIKNLILSSDRATLDAYKKVQSFIKKNDGTLDMQMIRNAYQQIKVFQGKDKYESYAIIFLAIEFYKNGEDL